MTLTNCGLIISFMSKKNKNKKGGSKNKSAHMPAERNPVVLIAKMRNSAGPMKSKNQRRQNRKSWKKDVERDMLVKE